MSQCVLCKISVYIYIPKIHVHNTLLEIRGWCFPIRNGVYMIVLEFSNVIFLV